MDELILKARRLAGLSQDELARRSGTSRPTLSAYERGRKSPSLMTTKRIVRAAGFELDIAPAVSFQEFRTPRGRVVVVPDRLWRLPVDRALADVVPPIHLEWSAPGRRIAMRERQSRQRLYEVVIREGGAQDLRMYLDGALLLDSWSDLVLPRDVRALWQPLVDAAFGGDVQEMAS